MRLTAFTDYGLRVLIYLSVGEAPASLDRLSAAYGISRNHLSKVVTCLSKGGLVRTKRGQGGGIVLARPAAEINIADVLRLTEPDFNLVDCFDANGPGCVLSPACALRGALHEARGAFLDALGRYTLADITKNRRSLAELFM